MRGCSRGWKYLQKILLAGILLLLAGCSVNSIFVYKPDPLTVGGPQLALKVAVLPFKDNTEDFIERGGLFSHDLTYNLAKGGFKLLGIDALTPDLWAKAFADDLANSAAFQSVRFFYLPAELTIEEVSVEGTVEKAYFQMEYGTVSEFAIHIRAYGRQKHNLLWEKKVERAWKSINREGECNVFNRQCVVDTIHTQINMVMQEMFAEARTDLVRVLVTQSGIRAENGGTQSVVSPLPLDLPSVDVEIEKILNEK